MTALRPYTEYKPSGTEWLDDIPANWQVRRLKNSAVINPSKSETLVADVAESVPFVPMERLGVDGSIDGSLRRMHQEVRNGFTYFREQDVLLAKITPCFENGKAGVVQGLDGGFGYGSTEYHVLRAQGSLTPQHLYRIVSSQWFRSIGQDFMEGSAGQKRVPTDFVANFPVPLPPLEEQRAIANFLDAMDEKITRFIAARRRMIALLEEQKQAIINQAVTRGLDPDVPLKPSAIDWLGDIPAHWVVSPVRSAFFERNETNEDGAETQILSVMSRIGVIPYEEKGNVGNKASEDTSRYKIVRKNDLVLNSMNVIIGSVGISRYDGCLSPVYYVLQQNPKRITVRYAGLLFENQVFQKSLVRIGNGILAHRMRIPIEKLRVEEIPLPPLPEQRAIANLVDAETERMERVTARARHEIELIQEYRTRLISDVVTGKLDVREVNRPKLEGTMKAAIEAAIASRPEG